MLTFGLGSSLMGVLTAPILPTKYSNSSYVSFMPRNSIGPTIWPEATHYGDGYNKQNKKLYSKFYNFVEFNKTKAKSNGPLNNQNSEEEHMNECQNQSIEINVNLIIF